jgi:hypothetical protein
MPFTVSNALPGRRLAEENPIERKTKENFPMINKKFEFDGIMERRVVHKDLLPKYKQLRSFT